MVANHLPDDPCLLYYNINSGAFPFEAGHLFVEARRHCDTLSQEVDWFEWKYRTLPLDERGVARPTAELGVLACFPLCSGLEIQTM